MVKFTLEAGVYIKVFRRHLSQCVPAAVQSLVNVYLLVGLEHRSFKQSGKTQVSQIDDSCYFQSQ